MIKAIALAARKPGMSEADFHRYWREVHGPIAREIDTLRRYVQCHRLPTPVPGFDAVPYDGVADLWFDSLDDLRALPGNDSYVRGARADEPKFVDMSKLVFLATEEKVVIEGPPIARDTQWVKAIFLLRRRPDLSVSAFQDYWLNQHAPQIPRDMGVLRYVQCHQIPSTYAEGEPAYDGVAELYFADLDAFMRYWTDPKIQQIFGDDAPRFLDGAHCTAMLTDEYRVRWP